MIVQHSSELGSNTLQLYCN